MNPDCPFCGKPLILKSMTDAKVTAVNPLTKVAEVRRGLNDYWVCRHDNKRWLRSSVILKHTSRNLVRLSVLDQIKLWLNKYGW